MKMIVCDKIMNNNKQAERLQLNAKIKSSKKLYLESYGCQMNFSDSEIVASILSKEGYTITKEIKNLILK